MCVRKDCFKPLITLMILHILVKTSQTNDPKKLTLSLIQFDKGLNLVSP